MAFSGIIPTLNVPAPLSGIGSQVLGVALSPLLGATITSTLGLSNQANLSAEQLYPTLAAAIPDYDLGGFESTINSLAGQFIQGALGIPGGAGNSTLGYPGKGEEPEAEYGGFVYNSSTPVVFSLNRAEAAAKSEGMSSLFGGGESFVPTLKDIPDYSSAFSSNAPGVNITSNYGTTGSFSALGAAKLGAQDYSSSFSKAK